MYNITAIVPKGQGTGFSYAGVLIREVAGISDAHEVLEDEMNNAHNGIILIDEEYGKNYKSKLQDKVDKSTIPLVVNVPIITKWEYIHNRDEVFEKIVQRAIGYRIKLLEDSD